MMIKKGTILLNDSALKRMTYHWLIGITRTHNQDMSLWPDIVLLQNNPSILEKRIQDINQISFFFSYFYWIFNINQYRKNHNSLFAYYSYQAYKKVHPNDAELEHSTLDKDVIIENRGVNTMHSERYTYVYSRILKASTPPQMRNNSDQMSQNTAPSEPSTSSYFERLSEAMYDLFINIRGYMQPSQNHPAPPDEDPPNNNNEVIPSYTRITKALPTPEGYYPINEWMARRLHILELDKTYKQGDLISHAILKKARDKVYREYHPDRNPNKEYLFTRAGYAYDYILAEMDPTETEEQQSQRRCDEIIRQERENIQNMKEVSKEHEEIEKMQTEMANTIKEQCQEIQELKEMMKIFQTPILSL